MKNGTQNHRFDIGLVQTDADGVCRSMSADLLCWLGRSVTDVVGQFIFPIFIPDLKKDAIRSWEQIVASKEAGRFESSIVSSTGEQLSVTLELTPA
ncbi:MAG: hypothetical protein RL417_2444, partial [Pseudomonadota bacterium]